MQLSDLQPEFSRIGINLVTITYDSHADAMKFHQQHTLDYPILQDENLKYVNLFGILNEQVKPGSRWYGIPHPGIFLVDKNGNIHSKFAEENYRIRPDLDQVLDAALEMVTVQK